MCSPQKSDENLLIFTFLHVWIKTNITYTRLEVIAKQRSALQVEFITGVKLICYFVLYYCFLHWAHLPNMAVGDLAFYNTLYLWLYPSLPYLYWYPHNLHDFYHIHIFQHVIHTSDGRDDCSPRIVWLFYRYPIRIHHLQNIIGKS